MRVLDFLKKLEDTGIEVIAGVPDSTLKPFCDGLQLYQGKLKHYVTPNEGAAVGMATGAYLASGKPACVYMQNSGIGNAVNPLVSLANERIYGIPILFIVGWRGEPGIKDEPQHVFQGEITCKCFELLEVPYAIIDEATTIDTVAEILNKAEALFAQNKQFSIIVKKGTFEKDKQFIWNNEHELIREEVLAKLLEKVDEKDCIVSTTGKISRELYEQSNQIKGNHDGIFMTVGGMGHASMIALGIAKQRSDKRVYCIDGDGAVLMHMGTLPFIATEAPENFVHIVINNEAHESVGAMPTGCQGVQLASVAKTVGYSHAERIQTMDELGHMLAAIKDCKGPVLYEIMVSLQSRSDLGRPSETPKENKDTFMKKSMHINKEC